MTKNTTPSPSEVDTAVAIHVSIKTGDSKSATASILETLVSGTLALAQKAIGRVAMSAIRDMVPRKRTDKSESQCTKTEIFGMLVDEQKKQK
jgi:hypothetical protein